jgi:hypothetical protein
MSCLGRPCEGAPSRLGLGDRFVAALSQPGWQAEYVVTRSDFSYRDDPKWGWQQTELRRAVDAGATRLRQDGLIA